MLVQLDDRVVEFWRFGSIFVADEVDARKAERNEIRLVVCPDTTPVYERSGEIEQHRVGHARREFAIGDRLHIIPNHVCVAVNLHEQVYGKRGYQVEEIWKVEGRGKLQ